MLKLPSRPSDSKLLVDHQAAPFTVFVHWVSMILEELREWSGNLGYLISKEDEEIGQRNCRDMKRMEMKI